MKSALGLAGLFAVGMLTFAACAHSTPSPLAQPTPASLTIGRCADVGDAGCRALLDAVASAGAQLRPDFLATSTVYGEPITALFARLELVTTEALRSELTPVAKTLRDLKHAVVRLVPTANGHVQITIEARFNTFVAARRLARNARWGGGVAIAMYRHIGLRAIRAHADNENLLIEATMTQDSVTRWLGRFVAPASLRR